MQALAVPSARSFRYAFNSPCQFHVVLVFFCLPFEPVFSPAWGKAPRSRGKFWGFAGKTTRKHKLRESSQASRLAALTSPHSFLGTALRVAFPREAMACL